jgi:hypothetical protein
MAAADIYRKTALGLAEIKDRKLKLNPRLRTMLILVDGVQTEEMLQDEAAGVGAPADFLVQLVAAGVIELASGTGPAEPERAAPVARAPQSGPRDAFTRFREAKSFMNSTIVDAMGLKSFMFTMKLERANSLEELSDLIDAFQAALAGARDPGYARVMTEKLREMLR